MFDVGAEIKRRRMIAGISQNQLAKRAGCAQSTLSAIEKTTKKPSTETLSCIADALGCTVSELMGEKAEDAVPSLTRQERELLQIFRQLNPTGRESVLGAAQGILQLPGMRQEPAIPSAM